MKKIAAFNILFSFVTAPEGFAQFACKGSFLRNSTRITFSFKDKTELVLGNKDQSSNQIFPF